MSEEQSSLLYSIREDGEREENYTFSPSPNHGHTTRRPSQLSDATTTISRSRLASCSHSSRGGVDSASIFDMRSPRSLPTDITSLYSPRTAGPPGHYGASGAGQAADDASDAPESLEDEGDIDMRLSGASARDDPSRRLSNQLYAVGSHMENVHLDCQETGLGTGQDARYPDLPERINGDEDDAGVTARECVSSGGSASGNRPQPDDSRGDGMAVSLAALSDQAVEAQRVARTEGGAEFEKGTGCAASQIAKKSISSITPAPPMRGGDAVGSRVPAQGLLEGKASKPAPMILPHRSSQLQATAPGRAVEDASEKPNRTVGGPSKQGSRSARPSEEGNKSKKSDKEAHRGKGK